MNQPTAEILVHEWTFKTEHMRLMAIDACRLALSRGAGGEFSAMDLPHHGAEEHGGTGIAGSVFRQLLNYGIIGPVGAFVEGEFIQRRVRNAGGNPIGIWRLKDASLAHALLRAHGARPERVEVQTEMVLL